MKFKFGDFIDVPVMYDSEWLAGTKDRTAYYQKNKKTYQCIFYKYLNDNHVYREFFNCVICRPITGMLRGRGAGMFLPNILEKQFIPYYSHTNHFYLCDQQYIL